MQTYTDNGALSYATTGNPIVDFFAKANRDTDFELLESLLLKAYRFSPLDTLKIVFFKRDCRGGSGERDLFYNCLNIISKVHFYTVVCNMEHIPEYGSWKDYLRGFCGTPLEKDMLEILAKQLRKDMFSDTPSLAAKYAPSEGDHFDKKYEVAVKLSNLLEMTMREYRKMLSSLRSKINIVETQMCDNDWDIDYSKVPSKAFSIYRNAFSRHSPEGFRNFISKVERGESKINTGVLFPHDIARPYLQNNLKRAVEKDLVIDFQWDQYIKTKKKTLSNFRKMKAIPIIDVSGSMHGPPLELAVSIGLFLSVMIPETSPFHKKWYHFSKDAQLNSFEGETLSEMISNMNTAGCGMNTNLLAVFHHMLRYAETFNVSEGDMPTDLFVLSDMQFDKCGSGNTNFDCIRGLYSTKGYKMPNIHFWNFNGNSKDFPTVSRNGVTLLSGNSPDILQYITDGEIPTPEKVIRKICDSERYDRITL